MPPCSDNRQYQLKKTALGLTIGSRLSLDSRMCDSAFVESKLDASMGAGAVNQGMTSLISLLSVVYVLLSKNTPVSHIS